MKRQIVWFTGLVLLLLASCTNELDEKIIPQEDFVSFIPEMDGATTRATDVKFEDGDQIGVFASKYFKKDSYGELIDMTKEFYAVNVPYQYSSSRGGFVPLSKGIALPKDGSKLYYRIAYPYSQSNTIPEFDFYVKKDQRLHKDYTASDFMHAYSYNYADKKYEGSAEAKVSLRFVHGLSRIVISGEKSSKYKSLSAVELIDFPIKATFYIVESKIRPYENPRSTIQMCPDGTSRFKAITTVLFGNIIKKGTLIARIHYNGGVDNYYAPQDIELSLGRSITLYLP